MTHGGERARARAHPAQARAGDERSRRGLRADRILGGRAGRAGAADSALRAAVRVPAQAEQRRPGRYRKAFRPSRGVALAGPLAATFSAPFRGPVLGRRVTQKIIVIMTYTPSLWAVRTPFFMRHHSHK